MSFIVLFLSGLIYFVENNTDEEVHIEIKPLGIKIWNTFYDFSKINGYSYIYSWENALFIRVFTNNQWLKYIDLSLDNQIVSQLQEILPNYLEEIPKSERSITEKIITLLKL